MQIMTTSQFASYYRKITGLFISKESVAHLCNTGKLSAYKEPERRQWLIKVENVAVSSADYEILEKENAELRTTLKNIAKLAGAGVS